MGQDAYPLPGDLDLLGSLEQVAEVRLLTVTDGPEAGGRLAQLRTDGLTLDVHLDRGADIGRADVDGRAVGWRGQAGFPHPATSADDGMAQLRAWGGGLVMTGGLDHVFGPEESAASHFRYPGRPAQAHPVHGRVWRTPAALRGIGTDLTEGGAIAFVEAEVRQAAAFAENLVLRRRIEVVSGTRRVRIRDRVRNEGGFPATHMFLYHVNLGMPFVGPGAVVSGDIGPATPLGGAPPAAAALPAPQPAESERVYLHRPALRDVLTVAVQDPRGRAVTLRYRPEQLPYFLVWQSLAPRAWGVGLEPATNSPFGRGSADAAGELIWLAPGEERHYEIELAFSTGAVA